MDVRPARLPAARPPRLQREPTRVHLLRGPRHYLVGGIPPPQPPHGRRPDSICGLGSATDESIIRTDSPVTELTIRATTNAGAGRGLGLLQAGLLADPQPEPGSVTPFLRTICRNCQGETTSTTDTTLEGAPYTPSGLVTVCDTGSGGGTGGDECRSSTSLLLCERTADEGTSSGDLTATPVDDATPF